MAHYTKGGFWTPSIPGQKCLKCGIEYTAHGKHQKFCSKKCAVLFRAGIVAAETHTQRCCPGCGKLWKGPPSIPYLYCSKACIYNSGKWIKAIDANCEACGKAFKSTYKKETGKWKSFCSVECANLASRGPRVNKTCAECGSEFDVIECLVNQTTCSEECRSKYFIRDRSSNWTGGLIDQKGRLSRRIDRDGYAAKYNGEHRLVVEREIGRSLYRGEAVLCLDENRGNHKPENLFLCPNFKELGLINSSVVEWPRESNLKQYRVHGYTRPDVVLFLHDWETPRHSTNGRLFTRHPHAEEIIKRRRAGASVRELAKDFGMSSSGMANVVRSRL